MDQCTKDFHVSIIGGGIGGISAAIGMLRKGIAVHVFESASCFSEIGAGVSFGKNARTALERLGLSEVFDKQATVIPTGHYFQWRRGEGENQDVIATTIQEPFGNSSVHRAKYLDSLVEHIPEQVIHFGKRLVSIKENESKQKYQLHFADSSTHTTDVIVGYDGIRSTVREFIDPSSLQWSGTWAYRGLVPAKRFISAVGKNGSFYARNPQMFLGKDKHVLIFPIDDFETINIVAFTTDRTLWPDRPNLKKGEPWTQPSTSAEMLACFSGWGQDILNMLKCIEFPNKWALHQLVPCLDSYVRGAVVIAGDAAHGGTPHQGALAGQAIEDAEFLAWLLSHPAVCRANVKEALLIYDEFRRPRANRVLTTSLEAGDVYEYAGPCADNAEGLKLDLENRWTWIWEHDFQRQQEQAEASLLKHIRALNI